MVDLKSLQQDIADARRARIEAESAGSGLEFLVERMRAGRTLQQIEFDQEAED